MSRVSCVLETDSDKIVLRIGYAADEPGQLKLLEFADVTPEFDVIAAIAETANHNRSVGCALEQLLDWAFQEGRQFEREGMKKRLGLE